MRDTTKDPISCEICLVDWLMTWNKPIIYASFYIYCSNNYYESILMTLIQKIQRYHYVIHASYVRCFFICVIQCPLAKFSIMPQERTDIAFICYRWSSRYASSHKYILTQFKAFPSPYWIQYSVISYAKYVDHK